MNYNKSHGLAALFSIPASILFFIISVLMFDFNVAIDVLVGALGFFGVYFPTQQISLNQSIQNYGLTRSEYKYIYGEMKDAREKVSRLKQSYINIRSLKDAKLIYDIHRVVSLIMEAVDNDPKLFFRAQQFFHSNLDSAVNTVEQYLFLCKMPGKSNEEKMKLHEARISLQELKRTLQANIKEMNKHKYDSLSFEQKVIKKNSNRKEHKYALENNMHKDEVNLENNRDLKRVKVKTLNEQSNSRGEQNVREKSIER